MRSQGFCADAIERFGLARMKFRKIKIEVLRNRGYEQPKPQSTEPAEMCSMFLVLWFHSPIRWMVSVWPLDGRVPQACYSVMFLEICKPFHACSISVNSMTIQRAFHAPSCCTIPSWPIVAHLLSKVKWKEVKCVWWWLDHPCCAHAHGRV